MAYEGFEVFDGYYAHVTKLSHVSISRSGTISLNRTAFEALGSPLYVELLFHRAKRLIGIRHADRDGKHSIPVRKQGHSKSYIIAGLAFAKEYDIGISVARRFEASLDENMLIVNLNGASMDATRRR
jgi:hypothetical protein